MQRDGIQIRDAQPESSDGRLFAKYLDTAAEGFFQFMLGRDYVEIIARAFCQPGHDLSYQNVKFAQQQSRVIGMICGYTAHAHRHANPDILKQAAGTWHLRLRVVSLLFAPLMRILETLQEGDYYLLAIAIEADHRGQGVGSRLLELAEQLAAESGARRIALDVSGGNQGAQKLYARRGYTVASRFPKRFSIPGLVFYRMVKGIAAAPTDR